jgi:hypothetical protein
MPAFMAVKLAYIFPGASASSQKLKLAPHAAGVLQPPGPVTAAATSCALSMALNAADIALALADRGWLS